MADTDMAIKDYRQRHRRELDAVIHDEAELFQREISNQSEYFGIQNINARLMFIIIERAMIRGAKVAYEFLDVPPGDAS